MATSFPTTVRIDRRPEGTYYHFRRVYRARPAARIEFLRRMIVETDEIKELAFDEPAICLDGKRSHDGSFGDAEPVPTFEDAAAGVAERLVDFGFGKSVAADGSHGLSADREKFCLCAWFGF